MRGRTLVLATGIADILPPVPGMREAWGCGVAHCPYCHGWDLRGRPTAFYGRGDDAFEMGRFLTLWSDRMTVVSDGPAELTPAQRAELAARGVAVDERRVGRIEQTDGVVSAIVFEDGGRLAVGAIYVKPDVRPRSTLPETLGARLMPNRIVLTDDVGRVEGVEGLYLAGDVTEKQHQVVLAAASGTRVAFALNHDLLVRDTPEAPPRPVEDGPSRPTGRPERPASPPCPAGSGVGSGLPSSPPSMRLGLLALLVLRRAHDARPDRRRPGPARPARRGALKVLKLSYDRRAGRRLRAGHRPAAAASRPCGSARRPIALRRARMREVFSLVHTPADSVAVLPVPNLAMRLLEENAQLVAARGAVEDGGILFIVRLPADAPADALQAAIDLAATAADALDKLHDGDDSGDAPRRAASRHDATKLPRRRRRPPRRARHGRRKRRSQP